MIPRRLVYVLVIAVVVEVGIFQLVYRDLLWLNQPIAVLQAAQAEYAGETVRDALKRPHLTRRHLELLASATARPGFSAEHVGVLERLRKLDPDDAHLAIRLADAYRLVGRFDEARHLFTSVLEDPAR